MNELAARKKLLIRQSQLYREILALERQTFAESADDIRENIREQFQTKRWWLIGGVACLGWLFAKRFGGVTRWLPTALAAAKFAQRLRG
jgi:hypothetical protein